MPGGGSSRSIFSALGRRANPPAGVYSFKQQLADLEKGRSRAVSGHHCPRRARCVRTSRGQFCLEASPARRFAVSSQHILRGDSGDQAPRADPAIRHPRSQAPCAGSYPKSRTIRWLLKFQQKMFRDALPGDQRERFTTFLTPLLTESFLKEPTSGPAFVQMTAQLFEEVARNTSRLPEVEKLDIPVTNHLGRERSLPWQGSGGGLSVAFQKVFDAHHRSRPLAADSTAPRPSRRSDVRMKQFSRNSMFAP